KKINMCGTEHSQSVNQTRRNQAPQLASDAATLLGFEHHLHRPGKLVSVRQTTRAEQTLQLVHTKWFAVIVINTPTPAQIGAAQGLWQPTQERQTVMRLNKLPSTRHSQIPHAPLAQH